MNRQEYRGIVNSLDAAIACTAMLGGSLVLPWASDRVLSIVQPLTALAIVYILWTARRVVRRAGGGL